MCFDSTACVYKSRPSTNPRFSIVFTIGSSDSIRLLHDAGEQLKSVVVYLIVVFNFERLLWAERQFSIMVTLFRREAVIFKDYNIISILHVEFFHDLPYPVLEPQVTVAFSEPLLFCFGKQEQHLDVALDEIYFQEAKVGQLLVMQIRTAINANETDSGLSAHQRFTALLEASLCAPVEEL